MRVQHNATARQWRHIRQWKNFYNVEKQSQNKPFISFYGCIQIQCSWGCLIAAGKTGKRNRCGSSIEIYSYFVSTVGEKSSWTTLHAPKIFPIEF